MHWTRILERLFAEASTTNAAPEENWEATGLGSFLINARANQVGPFAETIITSREMLNFVMHSGPPELWQATSQRRIASILSSMGYRAHDFHAMENGKRVHRRAWYLGSKREFLKNLELKSKQNASTRPGPKPEILENTLANSELASLPEDAADM